MKVKSNKIVKYQIKKTGNLAVQFAARLSILPVLRTDISAAAVCSMLKNIYNGIPSLSANH